MPYEEYDRLAWGYTKEEIRNLLKPRTADSFEDQLAGIIKPDRVSFYRGKGALSDRAHRTVQKQVLSQMKSVLGAFGQTSHRTRMEEDGGKMDVQSMYAWSYSGLSIRDPESHDFLRNENFLELRNINLAIGKKKLIADVLSCFVLVNEHTLYRMIQRGACESRSLKYLTDHIDEWLGYAAMFMLSHRYLGDSIGHSVLIPFADGALLGKMAFTETDVSPKGWSRHRLRLKDSINVGKVIPAPYPNVLEDEFQGRTGTVTLQISTWIPQNYFHTEQWWAKYRIEEFANEFKDVFRYCINAVHGRPDEQTVGLAALDVSNMEAFGLRLGRIFADPRWATACQW